METASAAARLKSIREATGLSLQKVADRMNMKLSSYRHYEERFKGASLPAETVEKLLVAFADFPDAQEDIRGLISVHDPSPGMSETGAQLRGRRLADSLYPRATTQPDITIRIDGSTVQVAATVDKQTLDRLIEKLEIVRNLLD